MRFRSIPSRNVSLLDEESMRFRSIPSRNVSLLDEESMRFRSIPSRNVSLLQNRQTLGNIPEDMDGLGKVINDLVIFCLETLLSHLNHLLQLVSLVLRQNSEFPMKGGNQICF